MVARAEKIIPVLILALGLLHGLFYLTQNGQRITNFNDIVIIAGFLHHFSESLWAGYLYPRWLMPLSGGAGLPVFLYYPPAAFYAGSLFKLPASLDPFGVYQLGLAMSAGLIVCALGYYQLLKRHTDAVMAGLIACLLLCMPLTFELMHTSMGLARIWALAWFPWGIYCLDCWREKQDRRFLLGFSLALALILLTHLPSFLLLAPALWIYGACCHRPSLKTVSLLSAACLFAPALAAVYLVPAYANRLFVRMDEYLSFFSAADNFQFFSPIILLAAAPCLLFAAWSLWLAFRHPQAAGRIARPYGLLALAAALFLLPLSKPLWDHVALLHWLQTPSRFLSLLFALTPVFLLAIGRRTGRPAFVCLILLLQGPSAYVIGKEYLYYRDHSRAPEVQRSIRRHFETGFSPSEYTTIWMPDFPSAKALETMQAQPRLSVRGRADTSLIRWGEGAIRFEVKASQPARLEIRQHYFPGWRAVGDTASLLLYPGHDGLMQIDIPAGKRRVTLVFSPPGAKEGGVVSLISLLAWVVLFFRRPRRDFARS